MAFSAGTRLGSYEIIAALGAGGMGEVYRARDTKLNRDVALKILPDAFASDPDRVARFTREARTLATLNHPHIAHIHGLEESGGVRALVMELVEGQDLAQRIARGPILFDEALTFDRSLMRSAPGTALSRPTGVPRRAGAATAFPDQLERRRLWRQDPGVRSFSRWETVPHRHDRGSDFSNHRDSELEAETVMRIRAFIG